MFESKILLECENPDTTAGGIYIPQIGVKVGIVEGKVIGVGQGRLNPNTGEYVPPIVKPGDRILFNFGTAVTIDHILVDGVKKKFYVIPEVEIISVLEDNEKIEGV